MLEERMILFKEGNLLVFGFVRKLWRFGSGVCSVMHLSCVEGDL